MMYPWGCGYGSPWGWIVMGLWMVFFVILAVSLLYYFTHRYPLHTGRMPSTKENPMEIVKARYARGEISKEEFEQIKRDLQS